jgi:hypothetical protein
VARLDGDGKGGAVAAGVVADHRRQVQAALGLVVETQTDDAAALADQQCHLRRRDGFGGVDQVAFVFAILKYKENKRNTLLHQGRKLEVGFA